MNYNYCHQPGHWKFDCLKLKENKEEGEKSCTIDNRASIINDGSNDEFDYVLSMSCSCLGNS